MRKSINPYNKEVVYEFEELPENRLQAKLELAANMETHWKGTSFTERASLMKRAAKLLRSEKQALARTITLEMGKPISQSLAEIEKCAWVCEYYADNAEVQLSEEIIRTDADFSSVCFEPLGVILAIMPWNYPFWQVFRFAVPALMAGNVGLLKHASNVLKSAELIEGVFLKAGFPEGCFQHLIVDSTRVEGLLRNPIIKAVTLTGSKPAGASVAAIAGEEIKKSVLELGGSNALLVFEDANPDETLRTCIQARFQNTGQSCIAGKRLLLQKGIAASFTERLIAAVNELKCGDPINEATYVGVLAREDLARTLEEQVKDSVAKGALILTGGRREGSFFEPTLVSGVTPDMRMFREETFGPALGITVFEEEDEGVALVNASNFGLGVSVFTSDRDRVERLIPGFYEGAVFINELVKSDPRLPFGGVKESGYGRELSGHGIREFVNKKTVYIRYS